jgi:hypothetical protein
MKVGTLKKILEKIPDDYEFVIDDADTGWVYKPNSIVVWDEKKWAYPYYNYYESERIDDEKTYGRGRKLKGDEDDHTTN